MAGRPDSQPTPPPFIGILDIRGRNGSDSPFVVPDWQCLEAMNIDWFRSSLGRKRGGSNAISLVSSGTNWSNGARTLARHVPGFDQTAAEFWGIDGDRNFHRLAGSAVWASPTVLDACTANPQEANWQSFNGKLYIAYKSAHNRLHLWDGSTVRRAGLDKPSTPAAPVETAGAVTDTRKYRIVWEKQDGSGFATDRSNPSDESPAATLVAERATVTRGTPPGEGETHWKLYAASTSTGFGDYRLVATTVIGTATAEDNNATLPDTVMDDLGANTPPPSCRYLAADDARIIMAGAYEDSTNAENAMAPSVSRVWWTSLLGLSGGVGNDERVSNTGTINSYADVEEAITGLSQPMQIVTSQASSLERGSFYVFSFQSQWKFVSTGQADGPYLRFRITGGAGCVHHKSILVAKDTAGNPCLMWLATSGVMRIGVNGQEYVGEDCIDVIGRMNLDATIPCHAVYHADIHQVWWYIAIDGASYPNYRILFDTRLGKVTEDGDVRGGWSVANGEAQKAYCSCMFSDSIGATMGRTLLPYIGYTEANEIWKCDTDDEDDNGNAFQAYIDTKSYAPWGLGRQGGMNEEAILVADPSPGTSIQLKIYWNEGASEDVSVADLTDHSDSGMAAKVFPKFEGSQLGDSMSFRCRIGDAQPIANAWALDALIVPVSYEGMKQT